MESVDRSIPDLYSLQSLLFNGFEIYESCYCGHYSKPTNGERSSDSYWILSQALPSPILYDIIVICICYAHPHTHYVIESGYTRLVVTLFLSWKVAYSGICIYSLVDWSRLFDIVVSS